MIALGQAFRRRRINPKWSSFSVLTLTLVIASGCGSGSSGVTAVPPAPPTTAGSTALAPGTSLVAAARGDEVAVFDGPDGSATPNRTLANPTENGAPLVFLVDSQVPNWVHVDLPVRPNGSTGWVRAADVDVTTINYRVVIELGNHRITVYRGENVMLTEPVGVGTGSTPTPGGTYYIKELLQPPDPSGAYGPYAYGLSGFSNVLTSFAGGDGVVGIHGTNDPSAIGRDVSHGCIRMSNSGITTLSKVLPLGTPVQILP